ncbi:hypothetical protein D3C80_1274420 [compost metagenome]
MHVVEVDDIDPKPLQRAIHCGPDEFGTIVEAPVVGIFGRPRIAELGADDDLVTMSGEEGGEEFLVGADPIHVGGVEHGDTQFQRALQRCQGFGLVGLSIEFAHAHAAQSLGADHGAALSELQLRHGDDFACHSGSPYLDKHLL